MITGAANGLGKALAKEFYQQGYRLALIDIDRNGLEAVKRDLDTGAQILTIHPADVSSEQEIIRASLEILNHHHAIDILVNNAGVSISQPFEQMDLSDYKKVFETNFWGTVHCTKYFLPHLKKQPAARLVNIISDFALMGFPGKTAYGSSKSAMMGFTNALKTEISDTSVKTCLVIPPPLNTGLVRDGKHISEEKRQKEVRFLEKNGMPLEKAAKKIVRQVQKGKYRIIIGRKMFWLDVLARLFPTWLHGVIGKNKKKVDFV